MPNQRYYKISPRGFANDVTYLRIHTDDEAVACEAKFADYEDQHPGASTGWTSDKVASAPGVAINWRDREYAGYGD